MLSILSTDPIRLMYVQQYKQLERDMVSIFYLCTMMTITNYLLNRRQKVHP